MNNNAVRLLALFGPPCVGKTELLKEFATICNKNGRSVIPVMYHTTGEPRRGETKADFRFISDDEFSTLEKQGMFVYVNRKSNRPYGLSVYELSKCAAGKILLFAGERSGAQSMVRYLTEKTDVTFLSLFCLPPGKNRSQRLEFLHTRLLQRKLYTGELFKQRVAEVSKSVDPNTFRAVHSPFHTYFVNPSPQETESEGEAGAKIVWEFLEKMEAGHIF